MGRPFSEKSHAERFETIVVGGGQAGLAVGYHLRRQGLPFVILDANDRIGGAWRNRWDSLRLFTPGRYSALPGMPFPGTPHAFPTKDEVADYLEEYVAQFELPVRTGVRVDRLSRDGDRFELSAGQRRFEADNVVVAMATHQVPWVPPVARGLDSRVVQLHAADYRDPSQLREGGTLVVGVGNSGAEIAVELAGSHRTWLAGRETGHVPVNIDGLVARYVFQPLLFGVIGHYVLTVNTPIGRRVRPRLVAHGAPLVRIKPKDLAAARVERVPRVVGVRGGLPMLEDERALDVGNVYLVHRVPSRLLMDRSPRLRQRWAGAGPPSGDRRPRARSVSRGLVLPLCHVVGIPPRRREGRGLRGQGHRRP